MNFLYLAPNKMSVLYGTVTGPVINSTYDLSWLVDGLVGRPLRAGNTTAAWQVTHAAATVNFIAALNWNADAGKTIAISGGVTQNLTMPNYAGRVPINPYKYFSPNATGVTSITATLTSNSVDIVAGQLVAGQALTLERPIQRKGKRSWLRFNQIPNPDLGHVAVTRRDRAARKFSGTTWLTRNGYAALQEWYDSTNDGELISVVVPDQAVNDAWAVKFDGEFVIERENLDAILVTINLVEIARVRW
jgi:hypothetical protein